MADVQLRVNGKEFSGWKSARVSRGIESACGDFELAVSDRWASESESWQIYEEDECTVLVDGKLVITGYVDKRSISYSATSHEITFSGRDKAGELVDCSAILDKFEFKNISVMSFAEKVAASYGVTVTLQSGIVLPSLIEKVSIDPGESAFEAIEKVCRLAGLLPISDGAGGLVLTRTGASRATTTLEEGVNILSGSSDFDFSGRFYQYFVLGQHKGSDTLNGKQAASIKGFATDENVRRTTRQYLVRPEGNVTTEYAKRRAEWEATVRAGRSESVSITVQGWTQADGTLWPINALVSVKAPMLGVNGEMLITSVSYSIDEGGQLAELTLRAPTAFTPEPTIKKPSKKSTVWKEIARGV